MGHLKQVKNLVLAAPARIAKAFSRFQSTLVQSRLKLKWSEWRFGDAANTKKAESQVNSDQMPVQTAHSGGALRDGMQIYAVGDVHGRADLLLKLLEKIEADSTDYAGDTHLIFLGDYIDRGFQSRQVLDILLSERVGQFQSVFLKGNHEEAMMSFMRDYTFGPKWAAFGGRETLVSYGVKPPRSMSLNDDWKRAHSEFIEAIPEAHGTLLMSMPTAVQFDSYGFVHAGIRPGIPFDEQTDTDRLWIREEFLNSKSSADVFVVHGHTPTDQPFADGRRINVDTGAYFTGRLTAVKLESDKVAFISTET